MTNPASSSACGALAAMWFCLFFPTASKVQRAAGDAAVVAYGVLLVVALGVGYCCLWERLRRRLSTAWSLALVALTIVGLVGAFVVIYPKHNAHQFGKGSDRDEALNAAVHEMIRGHFPYYQLSIDGNEISPFPGALMLSTPFVLMGNGAYQNFVWLAVFFALMWWYLGDARSALLFFWTVVLLGAVCVHEIITGGDYLVNTLWVVTGVLLMTNVATDPNAPAWKRALCALFYGLTMSTRPNFVLIAPVVLSAMIQRTTWRSAIGWTAVAAAVAAAVTLPYLLYDPAHFAPLHVYDKLAEFRDLVPYSGVFVPAVTALLALGLAFLPMKRDDVRMLAGCSVILAFPIVCAVVFSSIREGRVFLDQYAWYGMGFMVFGALSAWIRLETGNRKPETRSALRA